MSILVFGSTGQVAKELAALPDTVCLGRAVADLSDPQACADAIRAHAPRAVINAAAYTAVDKAESEEELAAVVNGHAPTAMAAACAALGIPLVHISTDYVFNGTGTDPWNPDDPTEPLGAYGRTKLIGEDGVRASGAVHAILRTSWVFSAHGANFVKTMLRLGAERDNLSIVADQIGGPTPARTIASACHAMALQLIESADAAGTYHFSGAPDCSWADFARVIFDEAGIACDVSDIPTSDYPTPAARPANSRMNCGSLADAFGIARPDWRVALRETIHELKETS
ncbi:dTDP-4-dehydrorhamnose reductase [uncultured Tateyamaria sp.]|uniref:dTDP-4-dehydrorhamnose reductase n=1 Tax=uncultured Tateyamaria sp. TaxID=455651 RepID=UPI0026069EF1|nr:dTDP-4-dehydrorhamnose reductase [uncultured Tateyamaria sp.]